MFAVLSITYTITLEQGIKSQSTTSLGGLVYVCVSVKLRNAINLTSCKATTLTNCMQACIRFSVVSMCFVF